ncbi:MAG TPA: agglutinin biogenesis protein MshP [Janthinobacterium sp.]|jgi:MSHA biogenesis protein MshP|nr:agglutinin biogenesis protein MshP [Janthinobacterium sp.]
MPARMLSHSRGVSLVTAIFLLVVLAGLGVAMLTVTTAQQQGSAIDVQGTRAYQAARAGMEWALYQQQTKPCPVNMPPFTFALPAGTTLSGFAVTVTCQQTPSPANASIVPLVRYHIISVACNQPGGNGACPNANPAGSDYVQRQVQVEY